jgi:hypothetical protein
MSARYGREGGPRGVSGALEGGMCCHGSGVEPGISGGERRTCAWSIAEADNANIVWVGYSLYDSATGARVDLPMGPLSSLYPLLLRVYPPVPRPS